MNARQRRKLERKFLHKISVNLNNILYELTNRNTEWQEIYPIRMALYETRNKLVRQAHDRV